MSEDPETRFVTGMNPKLTLDYRLLPLPVPSFLFWYAKTGVDQGICS